jgi:hypothetical protein
MDENPYKAPLIEGSRATILATIAKFLGLRPTGRCSYCGEKKRPLAEGIDGVLICRVCAEACLSLIDEHSKRAANPENA